MKGTQDHGKVDPSGRRNGIQSRRGFTILRSWLFVGVVAILATPAMAQIGETVCACSPAVFNMTLDFSLTCADANVVESDGVVTSDCSITPFQGEVSSLVPVNVFSVDFLELDQAGEVLNQRSRFVDLDDGATVSYVSFSNNPELVDELTAPLTLIVSFIARNAASEPLFMQYLITYTNSCDAFPVLTPGQQIGWTRFTLLEDPSPDICAALRTPTFAPTFFTSTTSPSPSPLTFAPTPTRPLPTRAPSRPPPTRAPVAPLSPAPTSLASPAPTVTCVPRPSKKESKGSKSSKGSKGKGKGKGKGNSKTNVYVKERKDSKGKKKSKKSKANKADKKIKRSKRGKEDIVFCDEIGPGSKASKASKSSKGKGKGKGKGVYYPPKIEGHPTYYPTGAPTVRGDPTSPSSGDPPANNPSADPPIDDDDFFITDDFLGSRATGNTATNINDSLPFGEYSSTTSIENEDTDDSTFSTIMWAAPLAAVSVVAAALAAFLWSRSRRNTKDGGNVSGLVPDKDEHSLSTEECSAEVPHEIPMHHPKTRRAGSKV